ncbi:hypothetical protein NDU88_001042 [Pleurodeles waltl]|uniref:Uncharacterized protein n=1 Tax=Pleurodeles waltl TaxID=8319 RepID=A0AAV7RBU0_PLEWA|nr:hypothetical protein NDU88_001042 [Pleurodeles waltl]
MELPLKRAEFWSIDAWFDVLSNHFDNVGEHLEHQSSRLDEAQERISGLEDDPGAMKRHFERILKSDRILKSVAQRTKIWRRARAKIKYLSRVSWRQPIWAAKRPLWNSSLWNSLITAISLPRS